MRETSFAEMAKPYVQSYGWPVFPVSRGPRKKPLVKGGCHAATTDPDLIDEWSARFSPCNIGVATGAPIGICVLDVDMPEGLESLNRLFASGLEPFQPTPLAQSGSGGLHYYFIQPPERLKNRAGKIAPGLDIRSTGGSIVVPPSIHHCGKPYRWLVLPDRWNHGGLVIPAPMPAWLRLAAGAEPLPKPGKRQRRFDGPPSLKILELEEDALRAARPGTRNDQLNRAAFVFGQFTAAGRISEAEARARLSQAALAIGLDRAEIEGTVTSGLRAGMTKPRE